MLYASLNISILILLIFPFEVFLLIPPQSASKITFVLPSGRTSSDFAKGIHEVINTTEPEQLSMNSRDKVLDNFTNQKVADRYVNLYKSLL